jgi:hypothetical protein
MIYDIKKSIQGCINIEMLLTIGRCGKRSFAKPYHLRLTAQSELFIIDCRRVFLSLLDSGTAWAVKIERPRQ